MMGLEYLNIIQLAKNEFQKLSFCTLNEKKVLVICFFISRADKFRSEEFFKE
jgi:hypothetical protein